MRSKSVSPCSAKSKLRTASCAACQLARKTLFVIEHFLLQISTLLTALFGNRSAGVKPSSVFSERREAFSVPGRDAEPSPASADELFYPPSGGRRTICQKLHANEVCRKTIAFHHDFEKGVLKEKSPELAI